MAVDKRGARQWLPMAPKVATVAGALEHCAVASVMGGHWQSRCASKHEKCLEMCDAIMNGVHSLNQYIDFCTQGLSATLMPFFGRVRVPTQSMSVSADAFPLFLDQYGRGRISDVTAAVTPAGFRYNAWVLAAGKGGACASGETGGGARVVAV